MKLDVNDLAQEIRRVDGNHDLGAAALAEALLPYLEHKRTNYQHNLVQAYRHCQRSLLRAYRKIERLKHRLSAAEPVLRVRLNALASRWDQEAEADIAGSNGSEYSREALAAGILTDCAEQLREALKAVSDTFIHHVIDRGDRIIWRGHAPAQPEGGDAVADVADVMGFPVIQWRTGRDQPVGTTLYTRPAPAQQEQPR